MITLLSSSSSFCILLSLTFLPLLSTASHHLITNTNETDRLALLEFKSRITHDPFGVMGSWNNSIHFCHWYGVTCGRRHQRVTVLDLPSHKLAGSISPHIGNLTFLQNLTIKNNSFSGEIPGELGRLHRLKILNLRNNSLVGEIPSNLSACYNLVGVSLAGNSLSGNIPVEIESLTNLQVLLIDRNNLTGDIPSSFGNLSSLELLNLASNHLSGTIPHTLGGLKSLRAIEFGDNDLEGTIPPSIFKLSSLQAFDVGENRLSGILPLEFNIFSPNLWYFGVFNNRFIGSIPPSITNASNLDSLQLGGNNFTGQVPNLENLHQLRELAIDGNQLGSGGRDVATRDLQFLSDLANNTNIETLAAGRNNLGGILPDFPNFSFAKLRGFGMEGNQIVGTLPTSIGNWASLQVLFLWGNRLSGGIPEDIGKLHNLQNIYLQSNDFSGNIPSSIGNLYMLLNLDLSLNKLQGTIPSSLGKCKNLLFLDVSDNNLNGSIPVEVFTISSLSIAVDFSQNQFTGTLPLEVGNLKSLSILNVSHNKLSGEIPNSLGDCQSMEKLDMSENLFHGKISPSLASLRGLRYMNLSHNELYGKIPIFLQTSHLEVLDLSFNNFSGALPSEGIFKNASAISFQGNSMLCGRLAELHLPVCKTWELKKRRLVWRPRIIIATVLSSLTLFVAFALFCLWFSKRKSKNISLDSLEKSKLQVSHQFLFKATDGFSATSLIGKGSFSSVYKGILDVQRIVAVKVFNLQRKGASRSFLAECEALKNIRHRNLLKVITVCSSIDFQGDDFKALVYEFMANGNLDQWLHPSSETTRKLDLAQRINIAIHVACALNYLHHEHCQTPIVHCDLKPSNVLLDDEMMAKVGDFGLMKFLSEEINHVSASSLGLRGTVGYAPPEYGMGSDVSTDGDMYSFGILLLEMFTGKRPTDDIFDSGANLRSYVKMSLPEKVAAITESALVEEGRDDPEKVMKSLIGIYEIGVACSEETPRQRMDISDALAKLIVIRDKQQQQDEIQRHQILVAEVAAKGQEYIIPKDVEAQILQRLTATEKKRGCVVPGMGGEYLRPPKPRGGTRTSGFTVSVEQLKAAVTARTAELEKRTHEMEQRTREREAELEERAWAWDAELATKLKAEFEAETDALFQAKFREMMGQFSMPGTAVTSDQVVIPDANSDPDGHTTHYHDGSAFGRTAATEEEVEEEKVYGSRCIEFINA